MWTHWLQSQRLLEWYATISMAGHKYSIEDNNVPCEVIMAILNIFVSGQTAIDTISHVTRSSIYGALCLWK